MAGDEGQGVLSEDNVLPQNPSEVADDLAATQTLPSEAPAALREDQVQNAVSFLNHPKVKGSSKESKVTFLEKKGLTGAEIEEAFKRAPDTGAAAPGVNGNRQVQAPPSRPFPTAGQASLPLAQAGLLGQQQQQQPTQAVRWTQVVIGASVVAAGAYALKQLIGPYAAKAYRKVYGIDETPEQSKQREEDRRTADLVASAIQSQTSELKATVESLKAMVADLDKANRAASPAPAPDAGISVADLRAELHAFASTLGEFEGREAGDGGADLKGELRELRSFLKDRLPDRLQSAAPASPRQFTGNGVAPPLQQVVSPSASRAPFMQDRKPEEAPAQPPHPPSYMEVLEMLERGETPPNVRTDINDQPPNPSQPPPSTRMQPRAKPWERSQASTSSAPNGEAQSSDSSGKQAGGPSASSKADVWKPPPVPKASLKRPGSSASSATGDD